VSEVGEFLLLVRQEIGLVSKWDIPSLSILEFFRRGLGRPKPLDIVEMMCSYNLWGFSDHGGRVCALGYLLVVFSTTKLWAKVPGHVTPVVPGAKTHRVGVGA
jgi:hypothetical protein